MAGKILGIVGSYRKGGAVDSLVTEALRGAEEAGAETEKLYLIDEPVAFCTNCRACTQEPGPDPGRCVHDDAMAEILRRYEACDGLVFGAPVNFYNVNALTRRFMERLVAFTHWPWGSQGGPKLRRRDRGKRAVVITTSAMPAFLIPLATGALRALRAAVKTMGARPVAVVTAGLVGERERPEVPARALRRARAAGRRLAAGENGRRSRGGKP